MRELTVHRQRALACFAMEYYCVVGQDREVFLRGLAEQEGPVHRCAAPALKNGQTIAGSIGEEETSLFVVACLDGRDLATETVTIPAGQEDAAYEVITDFDGDRKLAICIVPAGR